MNQAARAVAAAFAGEEKLIVTLAGRSYGVRPHSIKVICSALHRLSGVTIGEKESLDTVIASIPRNTRPLVGGIAVLIAGDGKFRRLRTRLIARRIKKATPKELNRALVSLIGFIQGNDFFGCAVLAKSVARMAAQTK